MGKEGREQGEHTGIAALGKGRKSEAVWIEGPFVRRTEFPHLKVGTSCAKRSSWSVSGMGDGETTRHFGLTEHAGDERAHSSCQNEYLLEPN